MNRLLLVGVVLLYLGPQMYGQGSAGYFYAQSHDTNAVDVKGVRHDGKAYRGAPPWLADRTSGPSPDYPMHERALHHQGVVIVRLTLDLKTGRVIKTSLLKSSGYPDLDRCAISAFGRWTWRPGHWKEIDMPTEFKMTDPSQPPVPGATRLPRS